MAHTDSDDRSSDRSPDHKKRAVTGKSIGGIAIIVLAGIYAAARPALNERFGWNLPDVRTDANGQVAVNDSASDKLPTTPAATTNDADPKTGGPLSARVRSTSGNNNSKSNTASPPRASADDEDLLYGLLKEVSKDRYVSPAGLQYTPGSAEGHRLEHLRRHTKDDPGRPGSHGVFDGGMEQALQTIEKAYERAKQGQRTTKKVDDGRTIYTVDMGSRVGYVGGREGKRKRNPMARRVRLVLEGTRVITAYPM